MNPKPAQHRPRRAVFHPVFRAGCSLFLLIWLLLSPISGVFAQTAHPPARPSSQAELIWLRVHVVRAEIWPRTASGECWDPCGWGQPAIPERQLHPYEWYWKHSSFREASTGWKAPDVRLLVKIGEHTFSTPVIADTTRPNWKFSKIVSVRATDGWRFKLLDDDSWGDQLIGQYAQKRLPSVFHQGGSLILRKIGQIELLELRIERLKGPPLRPGPPTPTAPTKRLPANKKPEIRASNRAKPPLRRVVEVRTASPAPPRRIAALPPQPRPKPLVVPKPLEVKPPTRPKRAAPLANSPTKERPALVRLSPQNKKPLSATTRAVNKAQTEEEEGELVRIDILGASIWPVKKDGVCWDFCWGATSGLPPRGMPFFDNYLKQPSFKAVAFGRKAPDPWLQIKVGKRVWTTPVQDNTVSPKWKLSLIAKIGPKTPISIAIFDRDTMSSELIGRWQHKGLPARWSQGGLIRVGPFEQVENVAIKVTTLEQVKARDLVLQSATSVPSDVRFVRVTVVKAKLWPLTAEKKCWDTCTSWTPPTLPPRGISNFDLYMKHEGFRSVATGRPAPDPRVKVQLGKYDVYITPTQSNTVQPVWNASHVFRLRGHESMTITVSDDDQNVAHDLLRTYRSTRELMNRWAEDVVGRYHTKRLPIQMIKGGRLILRSFGQVEYLELKIEPIPLRKVKPGCEGVYRVRVAEVDVHPNRADGRPWHAGVGSLSQPSPYARIWLSAQKIETPVAYKRLNAIYQTSRIIPIRKDTTMSIEVLDYNVGFSLSFDRQIKVPFVPLRIGIGMKNEPDSQYIGQTAFFSVCSLIEKGKYGVVSLRPFGRVKQVILFFDKIS